MFDINAETKIYTIISNPIKQVITPTLFNYIFKEKLYNAVYIPTHIISGKSLDSFFRFLRYTQNFIGVNVSIPYKTSVIKYLDELDDYAYNTGAVNTIFNNNGILKGYNTDGIGYVKSLKNEINFSIKNKTILILGAGGASRAIIFSLIKENPKKIYIANRSLNNSISIKKHFNKIFHDIHTIKYDEILKINTKNIDLIVNTTSLGLNKNDPIIIDIDLFPDDVIISDIIMNPVETKLIKHAKNNSLRILTGDNMLIYQINEMLKIWNLDNVDINIIKKCFPIKK